MMYPKTENTLAMLGGAALGAIAMFLLDPDSGANRRQHLAETAGNAAHRAGKNARSIGSAVSERLYHARKQARSAAAMPVNWFRHEKASHPGRIAAAGVGTMLLGAGLIYFMDPTHGRARRSRLMQRANRFMNRTGHTCHQIGRDLSSRAREYVHGVYSRFNAEDAVGAEWLLQRIRSELSHVVSHADSIQVMTDNQGRVTLNGKVLASEADGMLSAIKSITGVNEVINLLSEKENEQQMYESSAGAGRERPRWL